MKKQRIFNPVLFLICVVVLAYLFIAPYIACPAEVNVLPSAQHASDTTGVVLTDEQLCGLWEKATKLESVLSTCRDKAMALAKELSR